MKTGTILHHKYFNGVVQEDFSSKYKNVALKHFNNFGMYGTGMFGMIAKGPNIQTDYDWNNTDLLIKYANDKNAEIHFNTVITGHLDVFPEWFKKLNPEEKYKSIENHVRTVIDRYKEKVSYFKLVNEIVREPEDDFLGTGREKTEVVSDIFKWAVSQYPDGRYMLNEYGCLIREEIRKPFLTLVENIKERGARIDLIGEQAHSGYYPRPFFLPPDELLNNTLDEIHNRTQLPIIITEFDIGPKNGDYENGSIDTEKPVLCDGMNYSSWYEYQGFAYRHFKELCDNKGYIEEFYYWNMVDDTSMPWERNNTGLFDNNIEPKDHMKPLLTELSKEKEHFKEKIS